MSGRAQEGIKGGFVHERNVRREEHQCPGWIPNQVCPWLWRGIGGVGKVGGGGAIYTRILATTVSGLMEGADRGSRGMNGRMSEV